MSNAEQALSTVAGGVIGFFVGGPAGALYGAQIGLTAGTLLFPTELPGVRGPRLEDFERIDADPGAPVPICFGRVAVSGFRMYLGPVSETAHTEEVGGKGGPTQDVTTYTYRQTLALGLCEGPIAGVTRIWENGVLVYDARTGLNEETNGAPFNQDDYDILVTVWPEIRVAAAFDDINWSAHGYPDGMPLTTQAAARLTLWWPTIRVAANFEDINWEAAASGWHERQPGYINETLRLQLAADYAESFQLYLGTEDQEPDPTLEAEKGVGNVPAFRGLAYIVFPNRLIQDEQGRRHPVFKIELDVDEAAPPPHVIESVSPEEIEEDPSEDVTITVTGSGFTEESVVWGDFVVAGGTFFAQDTTFISETELQITVSRFQFSDPNIFSVYVATPDREDTDTLNFRVYREVFIARHGQQSSYLGTIPADVETVELLCVGAGGLADSTSSGRGCGGGGGGEVIYIPQHPVVPGIQFQMGGGTFDNSDAMGARVQAATGGRGRLASGDGGGSGGGGGGTWGSPPGCAGMGPGYEERTSTSVWNGGPSTATLGAGHAGGDGMMQRTTILDPPSCISLSPHITAGGGGGGAGGPGHNSSGNFGGSGGDGVYLGDIFGTSYGDSGWFGGGGGGWGPSGAGSPGAGTGVHGSGGGATAGGSSAWAGITIMRYRTYGG